MTLEDEVHDMLAAWDDRLRRIDESLLALEGEPTYQMLSGGARASLVGRTAERVGPALDALTELFEHRSRLNEVLARARELERDAGFWDKTEKLRGIAFLLQGPSIKLASRPTPLAQRNLLDSAASEVSVVPEQLLGAMARAYQVARDAVAEVGAAWARLEPHLEQSERDVIALRKQAADLGQAALLHGELAWLEAELVRVRASVANDPLGVTLSVDDRLAPRLAEATRTLGELTAQKARVVSGLNDAGALLVRVTSARGEALRAIERAAREVTGWTMPSGASDEEVMGLSPWRDKIASTAGAGHWRSADVGLTRWFDAARGLLVRDRGVCQALSDALDRRAELAGRLAARRAQVGSLIARGVQSKPGLDALASRADRILGSRPTDIEELGRAVDEYDADVVALAGQPKRGG